MLIISTQKALPCAFQPKAMLMPERWKNIPGYEGLYQVSNWGRIKTLSRTKRFGRNNNTLGNIEETIMYSRINQHGYIDIGLYKNGEKKYFKVHRLVAFAFVEGYFKGAVVNHKDRIRVNNNAINLEWCTQAYNIHHAFGLVQNCVQNYNVLRRTSRTKQPFKKVVNKQTGEIFDTVTEAASKNNVPRNRLSEFLNNYSTLSVSETLRSKLSAFAFQ